MNEQVERFAESMLDLNRVAADMQQILVDLQAARDERDSIIRPYKIKVQELERRLKEAQECLDLHVQRLTLATRVS